MIIKLEEDIGVKKISKFYLELKEIMKKENEIILDFNDVKKIDLSVAQVIIAADRELQKRDSNIGLKSASKQVQQQLRLLDFLN